jgi:putative ABC transport system permease protein
MKGARLAWHNLAHERVRFAVTVLGITFATLLMIVQGSLLMSFVGAASKIIEATDSDIWIAGRGTPCFEFPASLERRFVELAHSVPGVEETSRICTRIVSFRKPDGDQQLVTLIGSEFGAGPKFPAARVSRGQPARQPESLLIDESAAKVLNTEGTLPTAVELNEQRAKVVGRISGFSSFLGTPYAFASYADAAHFAGVRETETMFILVRLSAGAKIENVKRRLQERFPSADVWTRAEFSHKAQVYWTSQTGAGSAILGAALLGFLIGVAVVSQAMYATTMEHIEEFATLKALGAKGGFIIKVIALQALISGLMGYLLGLAISGPVIRAAQSAIPWLVEPRGLPAAILPLTLAICVLASVLSVRAALGVEPARVFRA